MNKTTFTTKYDLRGLEITRLLKIMCYSKIFPVGNFGTGPGTRCVLVLTALHTFGKPVFFFFTKYEERLYPLLQKLRKR